MNADWPCGCWVHYYQPSGTDDWYSMFWPPPDCAADIMDRPEAPETMHGLIAVAWMSQRLGVSDCDGTLGDIGVVHKLAHLLMETGAERDDVDREAMLSLQRADLADHAARIRKQVVEKVVAKPVSAAKRLGMACGAEPS